MNRVPPKASGRRGVAGRPAVRRAEDKKKPIKAKSRIAQKNRSQSQSEAKSADAGSKIDSFLNDMTVAELTEVVKRASSLLQEKRLASNEADALFEHGFAEGFDGSGLALYPFIHRGLLIVPGSLKDTNASGNHECSLCTVRIGDDEQWAWAHSDELMIDSKTFYDGQLRKTVSIYPAIDGTIIFFHERKKTKKSSAPWPVHSYKRSGGAVGFRVVDDDNGLRLVSAPRSESRPLPLPPGAEEE